MVDFGRAERVQIDLRKTLFDRPQQILVPLQGQRRVESALHQDLIAAEIDGFLNLLEQHLLRQHVRFLVTFRTVERTEVTNSGASVAVVDVAVDIVRADSFGMHPLRHGMSCFADGDQVVRVQQREGIVRRKSFARDRFSEQRFQFVGAESRRRDGRCESGHDGFESWKVGSC